MKRSSPLREITAARWEELYWGHDYPSLGMLADLVAEINNGKPPNIRALSCILKERGVAVRARAEQLRIDRIKGRVMSGANFPSFNELSPEKQQRKREASSAHIRSLKPESRRAQGMARRRRESAPCAWCGEMFSARPFEIKNGREACGPICGRRLALWRRYGHQGSPRPEILGKLLAAPRIDRVAEQIGATEEEIFEATYQRSSA